MFGVRRKIRIEYNTAMIGQTQIPEAIAIHQIKFALAGPLRDIGDLGIERPGNTGQLLKHQIGKFVGDATQIANPSNIATTGRKPAPLNIKQSRLDHQLITAHGEYRPGAIAPGGRKKEDYINLFDIETPHRAEAFEFLLNARDWDFAMVYFIDAAMAQHYFWADMEALSGAALMALFVVGLTRKYVL